MFIKDSRLKRRTDTWISVDALFFLPLLRAKLKVETPRLKIGGINRKVILSCQAESLIPPRKR
jgi:hypothetical protein